MAEKPSYKLAHSARKGEASMEIEGVVDATKPKTFVDKNLDPKEAPGNPAEKITSQPAKPGGSISPEPNAPKQQSGGGTTKVDSLTRT
jgi:hypothetical protein